MSERSRALLGFIGRKPSLPATLGPVEWMQALSRMHCVLSVLFKLFNLFSLLNLVSRHEFCRAFRISGNF